MRNPAARIRCWSPERLSERRGRFASGGRSLPRFRVLGGSFCSFEFFLDPRRTQLVLLVCFFLFPPGDPGLAKTDGNSIYKREKEDIESANVLCVGTGYLLLDETLARQCRSKSTTFFVCLGKEISGSVCLQSSSVGDEVVEKNGRDCVGSGGLRPAKLET